MDCTLENLNKSNLQPELKQVIQKTLDPDPSKRPTINELLDLLSKIQGYDQPFKESELEAFSKTPTQVMSQQITAEDIKVKPIVAKMIYHICSLLHKLTASRLFESMEALIYDTILLLLETGIKIVQSSADEEFKSQYIGNISKYIESIKKYYTQKSVHSSTTALPNLVTILEQTILPGVKEFISTSSPFESAPIPDDSTIRNCKRLFVICYLAIVCNHTTECTTEDSILSYKLSRLNDESSLNLEYSIFSRKHETRSLKSNT